MIFMNRCDKGTAPIVTLAPMPARALHPYSPPFCRHEVPVGDGHVLQVQEHGRANGSWFDAPPLLDRYAAHGDFNAEDAR